MESLITVREVGGNTEMSIGTTTLSSDSPREYDEDPALNFPIPKGKLLSFLLSLSISLSLSVSPGKESLEGAQIKFTY